MNPWQIVGLVMCLIGAWSLFEAFSSWTARRAVAFGAWFFVLWFAGFMCLASGS